MLELGLETDFIPDWIKNLSSCHIFSSFLIFLSFSVSNCYFFTLPFTKPGNIFTTCYLSPHLIHPNLALARHALFSAPWSCFSRFLFSCTLSPITISPVDSRWHEYSKLWIETVDHCFEFSGIDVWNGNCFIFLVNKMTFLERPETQPIVTLTSSFWECGCSASLDLISAKM